MTLLIRLLFAALVAAVIGFISVKLLYPTWPLVGEYQFTGDLDGGDRSLKVLDEKNIGMIYHDKTGTKYTYLGSLEVNRDNLSIVWIKEKQGDAWIPLKRKLSDRYRINGNNLVGKNGDTYKKLEPSIWQKIFSF